MAANVVGAALVYVYEALLAPTSRVRGAHSASWALVFLLVVAYLVVAVGLGLYVGLRQARQALQWFVEGRAPSQAERRLTHAQSWRLAAGVFVLWIGGACLFGLWQLLGLKAGSGQSARTAGSIVLGGLTSCGLGFLLVENHSRAVRRQVLADQSEDLRGRLSTRARLLVFWGLGSGVALAGVGLALIGRPLKGGDRQALFLVFVGLAAGGLMMTVAANAVTKPLDRVRAALRRVGEGDLTARVDVDDSGEIGQVQLRVNQMVAGLQERERLRDLLGRHVGVEVARAAFEGPSGFTSRQAQATVIFVDLIDSTGLSQSLPAEHVVSHLNQVFDMVVGVVDEHGGWVNKFVGDGALCVFGVPEAETDHASRALGASRALMTRLKRPTSDLPIDAAIGVSSGPVIAGDIGAERRYEYTVIGDAVNEAARLVEAAKATPGHVLASAAAVTAAGPEESAHWCEEGSVLLRGRREETVIYRPRSSSA